MSVPKSPLPLGEAYLREERVPQGEWPKPALDLLAAAWDLIRVRERVDEKNMIVDKESFDRLDDLLHEIKRDAEAEAKG